MSRRRYSIGQNPEYHQVFDTYQDRSGILSPLNHSVNSETMAMSDKAGMEALLVELAGTEVDGKYYKLGSTEPFDSKIRRAEMTLAAANQAWEDVKTNAEASGRKIPKNMPAKTAEKIFEAEAMLDVLQEEADKIKARLAEINAQEANKIKGQILKHGPVGAGKMDSGFLAVVDGQTVKPVNGVLTIVDDRSPYNGLTTARYFCEIVEPWNKECRRLWKELITDWPKDKPLPARPRPPLPPMPAKVAAK